jgi:hypothetical protein
MIINSLQDGCKGLRQLQELSVLTGFGPQVTVTLVIDGFGELPS